MELTLEQKVRVEAKRPDGAIDVANIPIPESNLKRNNSGNFLISSISSLTSH